MLQEDKKMKKEMAGQLHHVLTSIIVFFCLLLLAISLLPVTAFAGESPETRLEPGTRRHRGQSKSGQRVG